MRALLGFAITVCVATLMGPLVAEEAPTKPLIDFGAAGAQSRIKSESGNAGADFKLVDGPKGKALEITIAPGAAAYPGVSIKPQGAVWDLSAFGHIKARIANTGTKPLSVFLRVDNAGDWRESPWNTESVSIKPGSTETLSVIFGFAYGRKPSYALKSNAISNILIFTGRATELESFQVESLSAAGPAGEKPPVDPNTVRTKPKEGVIFGTGVTTDAAKQIEAKGGAQAALTGDAGTQALQIVLPAAKGEQFVALKPAIGRWDLREAFVVRVRAKNEGKAALTPAVQVTSDGNGVTDVVKAAAPLAPGAETEIVVPFAPAVTGKGASSGNQAGFFGPQKGTGTNFLSDAVGSIKITAMRGEEATLQVVSVTADTPVASLPDWLGKRPPVEGDWVQTFSDDFDGTSIDQTKWNIYGPNYWDKATHWSKDNLFVGDGVVRLHFEKKRGYHNDDPNQKKPQNLSGSNESDYACGFLETYGKWVQRYGYFEARMKLPEAPGLWPAFWMMPDRGVEAGPQFKRQDTGNGAMELDIMEHLTRWGPNRYNVAMHWDGYGKEHKSLGSSCNYVQPDKDGFITAGLLWTPGLLVHYCNGKEIFRWEDPRISTVASDLMLEMTTGGWDNNAVDNAQLPVDWVVDYVRAWQRKDLASPVDGFKSPAPADAQPAPKLEAK